MRGKPAPERRSYRFLRVEAGQRFGRLTVVDPEVRRQTPSKPKGLRAASCVCDCGKQAVVVTLRSLLDEDGTRSCGCAQRDWLAGRNRTHGLSDHPLFGTWQGMMQRCYYEGHPGYKNYGGRGVAVCDQWHDVRVFIEDIEREIGPRPEGRYETGRPLYELDRIDNDGNYEPGKVRWLTVPEQRMNARPHLRKELNGAKS
jgi:hypothetical protein